MNIKRKLGILVYLVGISLTASAQVNEFEEAYKAFRQQALKEYSDFRDKVNKVYADFMRQAWEQHQALPEIPKPKDEPPVPPTPYPIDDQTKPIKDTPKPYEEIVPIPELNLNRSRLRPSKSNLPPKRYTSILTFFKRIAG